MANKVLLKKSSVAAKVPLSSDLSYGELAVNYADAKLYFKDSGNAIQYFVSTGSTDTLTNKTLTSPTINSGALSGTFSGAITLSDTTASTSTTTGSLKLGGGLGVAGSIYADKIYAVNNGAGTNVYVGDDVVLGDVNQANTLGIRGQQDASQGYIVFGNANNTNYIGRSGTNPLQVTGQFKVDSGTITGASAVAMQIAGYANKGGTGYHDFLSVTNGYGSATNASKWFRLNSTGNLEIINSAYTAIIFSLTDAGAVTFGGTTFPTTNGTNGYVLTSNGTGGSSWTAVAGGGSMTYPGAGIANSTGSAWGTSYTTTGSGTIVALATSPAFTTSITTGSTSFDILNTTATTVNAFGASTATTLGAATGTFTVNSITLAHPNATSLTMNGASPSITTTSTGTASVFNTNALTGNLFGAATTVSIGASTGTTTINNNVTVTGNLTVNGTTTTLNATTITVDDINIELGSIASPTDTTANGGGITLKGTTDKTIVWDSTNTNWTSSENWNLATGKVYKINNVSVLSATGLGSAVVSSSLTSVGTLTSGTWNASVIGPAYGGTGVANNVASTLTISGAYGTTFTVSGATSLTLPTSGTVTALGNTVTGTGSIVLAASPTLTGTTTAANLNVSSLTSGQVVFAGASGALTSNSSLTYASGTLTAATSLVVSGTGGNITMTGGNIIGVAAITMTGAINKVTITAPATGSTLTIADGKTLTANNTLTFTGTDGSSVAFGAGGTVLYSGSTIPSGTVWNGNVIGAIYGGTGVANNAASTIAISGAYGTTFTVSGTTALTLPTSGTVTALGNSTTGTGNIVLAGAPTIAGGAHTGITNLAVRDTSAAYDVTIAAVSSTTLTAGRTLTIDVVNAARTLKFGGNLTLGANFTTDTNAISFATSGATSVTLPTSGTLATTGNLSQFAATTSAQLAGVISDETGSGALVFGTSPTFTTSIDAGATFTAFATPTTVTGFAAATSLTIGGTASAQTISIGASSTSASTYNFGTGATSTGNTKTVNLGTAGATGSTTNVNIGSASGGTTTVNNDLTVTGNLDVKGSVSFIESTTVQVADKNLELGKVVTPTDTTADGGGITLKGATDKTIIWDQTNTNWTSSENWNLATGKTFKINNVTVLSSTQVLGKTIGGTSTGDIVSIDGTQTLTNKTLTSPVIGTIVNTGTLTLPTSTDTLVGKATTDTLTNKTLSSAVITGTVTAGGSVGTAGYVLSSTGTGVQWIAQSGGGGSTVLYTSQSLSTAQQDQARSNIYAASPDDAIIYSMIF